MNEPVDVLVGRQFGNYRLIRALGHGGFAGVYLGENIYINTLVAVKVLQTQIEHSEIERFRFEARTIANLKHPHIVQLIDFGLEYMMPYLVMSYAPHGHLRQLQAAVGAFSLPTVVSYVKQIASALQFAHDHKIIHRDIKPENILLDAQDALLLSDFGIALIVQTTHQQSTRDITGTLAYMAPEQTQGKPVPASDQYALGITAYELLTGTRPFQGSLSEIIAQHFSAPPPSLREKLPTLPLPVEQVILRSLAKSPQERFPSVSAFAEALEEASKLQESHQDVSIHFYQADPLTLLAQQSFESKIAERSSFFNKDENTEHAQFTNTEEQPGPSSSAFVQKSAQEGDEPALVNSLSSAPQERDAYHGLAMLPLDATPTAPLPSVHASAVHPAASPISASLPAQTPLKTMSSPFVAGDSLLPPSPASSAQGEILPMLQNFLLGKRSYVLLSITLICVVIIACCSAIFIVHLASTHMAVQTLLISANNNRQPTTVPLVSDQQAPTANATPKIGKSATVTRGASTPTATGNLISTTALATPMPALMPTPTARPTAIPTATAIPSHTPSHTPTSGACSSFTGYYKIVNKNSGKNLDVFDDALTDSALIVQYTDNGKTDQQWSFVATSAGYCKIINRNSGDLLNIPGPKATSATQLIQFHDDGGTNSQWELVAVGNGFYKIVSRYDSQCIDVSQSSASDNGAVIQFPDDGGLNQQWQLVRVSS